MASERIRMPIQTRAAAGSDYAEHDDASVIGRSRNEPEVFEIVFRRYADQIQRYVSRRIGANAADDVVAHHRGSPTSAGATDHGGPRVMCFGRLCPQVRHPTRGSGRVTAVGLFSRMDSNPAVSSCYVHCSDEP